MPVHPADSSNRDVVLALASPRPASAAPPGSPALVDPAAVPLVPPDLASLPPDMSMSPRSGSGRSYPGTSHIESPPVTPPSLPLAASMPAPVPLFPGQQLPAPAFPDDQMFTSPQLLATRDFSPPPPPPLATLLPGAALASFEDPPLQVAASPRTTPHGIADAAPPSPPPPPPPPHPPSPPPPPQLPPPVVVGAPMAMGAVGELPQVGAALPRPTHPGPLPMFTSCCPSVMSKRFQE